MPRLRQYLPLCILDHNAEGVLLDLNAAKGRLVCDKTLLSLEGIAEHHVVSIGILWLYRCGQHPDPRCSRRDPFYLDLQRRIVLIRCIGEIQHLHPHRPVPIQVKCLSRTHPVSFPLHQSFTLCGIETHETIRKEIRIRQIIEVRRHILLHTLQILHTRICLYLRNRYRSE